MHGVAGTATKLVALRLEIGRGRLAERQDAVEAGALAGVAGAAIALDGSP